MALVLVAGAHAGYIAPLAPAAYGYGYPAAGHAVDYYVSMGLHNIICSSHSCCKEKLHEDREEVNQYSRK